MRQLKELNDDVTNTVSTLVASNTLAIQPDAEIQEDAILNDCQECPFGKDDINNSSCGCCILYVGGRKSLSHRLRSLVEQKEGVFLYHDGGLEKSTQELATMLNQADVVVFPVDCVSHKAYWQLKKSCKKSGKTYKILNTSSLTAFSNILFELSNEERLSLRQ